MALTNTCIRFILWAKSKGVSLETLLTLGHLENNVDEKVFVELMHSKGLNINHNTINWNDRFADTVFTALGSHIVDSLDVSNFENATIQHDLNFPLPDKLQSRYSAVIDGGTLEHVFNFPRAITSCMKALKVSGHFLGFSPVNNLMGHGFYQFSPELYFRIFSKENGFKIIGLFLIAADFSVDTNVWYEVTDPKEIRDRVTLNNRLPTYMMIAAKKIEDKEPFVLQPYQSDYSLMWGKEKILYSRPAKGKTSLFRKILNKFSRKKEEELEQYDKAAFKKRRH